MVDLRGDVNVLPFILLTVFLHIKLQLGLLFLLLLEMLQLSVQKLLISHFQTSLLRGAHRSPFALLLVLLDLFLPELLHLFFLSEISDFQALFLLCELAFLSRAFFGVDAFSGLELVLDLAFCAFGHFPLADLFLFGDLLGAFLLEELLGELRFGLLFLVGLFVLDVLEDLALFELFGLFPVGGELLFAGLELRKSRISINMLGHDLLRKVRQREHHIASKSHFIDIITMLGPQTQEYPLLVLAPAA